MRKVIQNVEQTPHLVAGLGFIRLVVVPGRVAAEPGTNIPEVLGVFLFLAPIFNMHKARPLPLDLIG